MLGMPEIWTSKRTIRNISLDFLYFLRQELVSKYFSETEHTQKKCTRPQLRLTGQIDYIRLVGFVKGANPKLNFF